jgi:hypothetical protein
MEGSLPRWEERPRPPDHGPAPGADPRRAHRAHTGTASHPAATALVRIKQHALSQLLPTFRAARAHPATER